MDFFFSQKHSFSRDVTNYEHQSSSGSAHRRPQQPHSSFDTVGIDVQHSFPDRASKATIERTRRMFGAGSATHRSHGSEATYAQHNFYRAPIWVPNGGNGSTTFVPLEPRIRPDSLGEHVCHHVKSTARRRRHRRLLLEPPSILILTDLLCRRIRLDAAHPDGCAAGRLDR